MRCSHVAAVLMASLMAGVSSVRAAPTAPAKLSAGDYAVTVDERGVSVTHQGTPISIGSYFNVFQPEYKGSLVGWGDCWQAGTLKAAADGRSATAEATQPKAKASFAVAVSEKGVQVTVTVSTAEDAACGPVEYPVFQFPPALAEGATVELLNAAGMTTDSVAVPTTPKRGNFSSQRGDTFILRTPQCNVTVSTPSYVGIAPFDGRVENYGKQQGVWAFATIPVAPGTENTVVMDLTVSPPDPLPEPGTLAIAPNVPATAVALAPGATAREKLAADELAAYLAKIAGCKLEVREIADTAVPQGVIAVGSLAVKAGLITQAELDAVRRDGYVVRVADGRAAVCGWRDLGTVYGAYALLGQLGVKFYAPGCEVVPHVKALTIAACEIRTKPIYEFRVVRGNLKLGHTPGNDMMDPEAIGEKGNIVHASEFLVPYEKYGESNPEFFALQKDGKRLHKDPDAKRFDVHLCLSNPDVRRISAERMLMLIEKQSDRTFFGVSQGDGFAWCECDACKALDATPGNMTDRLLDYVNFIARAVAAKYPDKLIVTLAYTDATSNPPTRVMPEPNVMVQYCPYPNRTACQCHDLSCEKNTQGDTDLKGWIAKCPNNMYIFDYPCGYAVWYEPFGSFYAMRKKLDFYSANGIRGIFYCGTPSNFRDLFTFVQSRLLWEPKADVEALTDEFMAAYYGKGAPIVREYFNFMHREVDTRPVHQMCEGPNPGLVTPEYAEKAFALFAQAEAAVQDDRAALFRVRQEKFHVLFADLNERNPVNGKLAVSKDEFAQRLAEFMKIGRDLKIGAFIRDQEKAGTWFQKTARVQPDASPWYNDPVVRRMIADPVGTLAAEGKRTLQKSVDGGLLVLLDGFCGGNGPQEYNYECPAKQAVWIYGKNSRNPQMWAEFSLDAVPAEPARLVLTAQDDDKPGKVEVRITINGTEIFAGPNAFPEKNWSSAEFAIPAGVLKQGTNEIRFATLKDSAKSDAGWFMLAECKLAWK
ncbi:MAG: hypothetical protein A3K19_24735 [Lentisphaerae bacterium RIFOXYB12_FULL_65_16]|nr:MAG: hypothetical protein A3K18_24150 [Lentisphaerae bacterium RIFOXYA12_64_32]OGV90678.1 MAG: hypothetical protein A3K19_24735 [Lentisphaerae bacterium RIFOXYB12_FULL_65_16]